MSVTKDIRLRVIGETKKYQEAMAGLPGITKAAAGRAAVAYAKEMAKVEAATAKAALKGGKDFGDLADRVGGSAGKMAGALDLISPAAGGAARAVADLADGAVALGSFGAVAGVVAAATLAVGGFVGGLGAAVLATDDALESLQGFQDIGSDFYPAVPASTLESVEAVNASLDALRSIGLAVVVDLGASVAPAFEQVANVAVGLALEARDLWSTFLDGREVLRDFAVLMVEQVAEVLLIPIAPARALATAIVALSDVTGVELPAKADAAIRGLATLDEQLAEMAVGFVEGQFEGSGLADTVAQLGERGSAFIGVQQRATAADEGRNDALAEQERRLREAADATRELQGITTSATQSGLTGYAAINFELGQQLQQIDALVAKGGDLAAAEAARAAVSAEASAKTAAELGKLETAMTDATAALEEAGADLLESWDATVSEFAAGIRDAAFSAASDVAGAVGEVFGAALDGQAALIGDTQAALQGLGEEASAAERQRLLADLEAQKATATRIWRGQQAAALGQALINGALAVTNIWANWAWNPIVAGLLTAGAGATTAAQVAVIGAQSAPEYHRGGIVDNDPSEVPAVLRKGEGVLTPQGVRAIGGREGLDRANRGQVGVAGSTVIELRVGATTAERIVVEGTSSGAKGRRLSRATRPRGRTHHYRRGGGA